MGGIPPEMIGRVLEERNEERNEKGIRSEFWNEMPFFQRNGTWQYFQEERNSFFRSFHVPIIFFLYKNFGIFIL